MKNLNPNIIQNFSNNAEELIKSKFSDTQGIISTLESNFEKGFIDENEFLSSLNTIELLEKGGKKAMLGEKRMFGGREYIKTSDGWKFHGKGTGTKAKEHSEKHGVKEEKEEVKKDESKKEGGEIIGHTKSGKPIYNVADHEAHANFTFADHHDAREAQLERIESTNPNRGKDRFDYARKHPLSKEYNHHDNKMDELKMKRWAEEKKEKEEKSKEAKAKKSSKENKNLLSEEDFNKNKSKIVAKFEDHISSEYSTSEAAEELGWDEDEVEDADGTVYGDLANKWAKNYKTYKKHASKLS